MQEIHSTGGGRFFVGAGDRRLRPHHLHNNNNQNQNQQALKCPRCDSLNTKFCYYNNYNLSQPRYFCKSCRRYWTKGGVLRNVPVGGGCRKSKRSKTKSSSSSSAVNTPPTSPQPEGDPKTSNSNSSSESSSLAAEAVSVSAPSSENLPESNLLVHPNSNPHFEPESGIFSEVGNLTSLMSSNNDVALGFEYGNINVSDTSSFQFSASSQGNHHHHHHHNRGLKFAEMSGSLLDQTVPVDLASKGFWPLDWQGSTDHQGLFDLPNTVDQAYWSHTHWNQDTPSTLFHLP